MGLEEVFSRKSEPKMAVGVSGRASRSGVCQGANFCASSSAAANVPSWILRIGKSEHCKHKHDSLVCHL